MSDFSIEDVTNQAGSIYEAVVVLSRRARQINDEQKKQIESEMDITPVQENRESEDFDDLEIDREALLREHKKYPKPTNLSIDEMLENKISYHYDAPEEETEKKE
jgi:DNA-directed RNA polymerase omega subunit